MVQQCLRESRFSSKKSVPHHCRQIPQKLSVRDAWRFGGCDRDRGSAFSVRQYIAERCAERLSSAGAPGIPGAGVICLSVLLQQLGVPTDGVGMVMGIGPILGMFMCMTNCLGDVVVSAIVARRCGEIDLNVYSE